MVTTQQEQEAKKTKKKHKYLFWFRCQKLSFEKWAKTRSLFKNVKAKVQNNNLIWNLPCWRMTLICKQSFRRYFKKDFLRQLWSTSPFSFIKGMHLAAYFQTTLLG
jgi:hypothetical protein